MVADKYVLGDVLGIGGMGIVYRATQQWLDRTVVVKLMRPTIANNPIMLRRFRDEALAGSRLSHPNIAGVIDFGVTAGADMYLVMEYVRGQLLSHLIANTIPFDIQRGVAIVRQLLAALGEAHTLGIVHADVKSDNVLVELNREGVEQSKLIDFGLARFVGGTKQTGEHLLSGTPEYLAPEVIDGLPPSASSDIYAVGVILYELLTGATPFGGGTCDEILARHRCDEVVPPSLRCPDRVIPVELERIVLCALEKDPAARFANAAVFAEALSQVPVTVTPTPIAVHPSTEPQPFSTEAPTQNTPRPRRRFPVGTPLTPHEAAESHPIALAREAVGDAIIQGDVDLIIATYLQLARALIDDHNLLAAAKELEEAIEYLSLGGNDGPAPVWRLLLSLSALYAGLGDARKARRAAIAGRDHAARAESAIGQDRAHALIHRLVHGHGQLTASHS